MDILSFHAIITCTYILGLGPDAEVLHPPELREKLIRQAESVLAFYGARLALAYGADG